MTNRCSRCGSGFDRASRIGPLVSAERRARVQAQVDDAVARGARLLLGGAPEPGPGFFYPATVLADVAPDWPIAREETFGPVICLSTFDGSATRYELAKRPHHDHLIDVETGEVREFVSREIEHLQARVAEEYGYEIIAHRLELYCRKAG